MRLPDQLTWIGCVDEQVVLIDGAAVDVGGIQPRRELIELLSGTWSRKSSSASGHSTRHCTSLSTVNTSGITMLAPVATAMWVQDLSNTYQSYSPGLALPGSSQIRGRVFPRNPCRWPEQEWGSRLIAPEVLSGTRQIRNPHPQWCCFLYEHEMTT